MRPWTERRRRRASRRSRARTWDGNALTNVRELFSADVTTEASRIVFGSRRHDLHEPRADRRRAQTRRRRIPNNYGGKLLRLRDDGTVPPDNPFVGRAGYKPEIFTMGHRNQLGLARQSGHRRDLGDASRGPNGGDEINIIQAGKNYGWPVVSYGRSYPGPRVSDKPSQDGMEQPTVFWMPSIALSGLTFYTGDKFPGWKNNVFVGGLRQGEVPRTGQLAAHRVQRQVGRAAARADVPRAAAAHSRRASGTRWYLYVLTEENDGALIRIEPA